MNKIYIYLKEDSDLGEVIEKVRGTKEKEIVLVIPQGTKIFLHPINLEIFKKEFDSLEKRVYLSTEDEKIINLAKNYNLLLFLEDKEEKQIIDVKPPRKKSDEKKEKIQEEQKSLSRLGITINFKKIIFYIFSLSFLVLIIFLLFQLFQTKAQVIVEIQKSEIEINEIITLDKNILAPDYEKKKLPAEEINFELSLSQSTSTTGKVFTQQEPLLKVTFLNYLERDIPLVAGTRLAYQNNIFRTTEKIVIPAKKQNEPGQISTQVFPSEIVDDNLVLNQNTDLKIVALENKKTETGMLWSDVLKVKVDENYNLNQTQQVSSVTPEDITNIKLLLENSLKESIQTALAIKYPQSFYIFDPALVEVKITNISNKVGEKTSKISAMGIAQIDTLATTQKEFDDFISYLINQQVLKQGQNLSLKEFKNKEIALIDFDKRKKIATIGFKAKTVLVPNLNTEKIKADLVGKNLDEVKNYFSDLPGVNKISIKIFPQWKNNFPKDIDRIQVIIK